MSLRLLSCAAAAALLLAGCEAQPLGTFQPARYVADSPEPEQTLFFAPGHPTLASGEIARLKSFLGGLALGPEDDVILYVGQSGSPVLNARRLGSLEASFPATRARVRVITAPEAAGVATGPDGVVVRAVRYDRIRIDCPGNPASPLELTTPLPDIGCANAFNRATMAASPRDLIAPRSFGGTDATVAANAVQRLREGKVIVAPLQISTDSGS